VAKEAAGWHSTASFQADPKCPRIDRPASLKDRQGSGTAQQDAAHLQHCPGGSRARGTSATENLGLLDALALRLDPASAASFRPVVGAMAASFGRPWPEEARAMAAEAAATWLAPPGEQRQAHRVLDGAIAVAWHGDWTAEDAALLEGAAADACTAILTSGIVHPTVTAALYAPFAEAVSFEALQDDLERTLASGAAAA
jgi:hypothetical protein